MQKPGYCVEREIVVVAPDGQFAAFTETWLDDVNKVGLFEPVGTHKDFQRRGLGRAMMLHTLHEMKSLGMKTAIVGHEINNPASTGLYNSLGFRTKYEITDYKKL
ncbi:MAG: GNAT family N-acetyltransferase [Anaerolineae bacterium]|nr:GNAT family N-acetyltransferase [Anaerolineae bacterium]